MSAPDNGSVSRGATSEVICCEGPPTCPFEGDEAVANQLDGCPRCKRIVIHEDGSEEVYRRRHES